MPRPFFVLIVLGLLHPALALAQKHSVLSPSEGPGDTRVAEIKTYNTPQTFSAPTLFSNWKDRKEDLRIRILNSCGLLPMPEIGDLKYDLFDKRSYDDYTVEKVFLQTYPGYYATGNLYRPVPKEGEEGTRYPGILCPHGHWTRGRLEESDRASVPRRAVSFAKQGYVVFTYDMVGYMDNGRFLDHNVGGERERIWAISPAGIQTLTSLRGIELLLDLPDVDPERLGCTGASGGGTQTFLLCGIDDRIKVGAPVNMISSTMQGGCVCENPTALRHDTNNMEIGALMAPRPQIMISATGDWTKLTPTVEYPAVKSVYWLYGVPQRLTTYQQDEGHNYNLESRQPVYEWFAKWFYPMRSKSEFVEPADLVIPPTTELAIFPGHATPSNTLKPQELFASIRQMSEKQLFEQLKRDRAAFLNTFGRAYRETLICSEPDMGTVSVARATSSEVASSATSSPTFKLETFLLKDSKTGQSLPSHFWTPTGAISEKPPVVLLHPEGKGGLLEDAGYPQGELRRLLEEGRPVLAVDVLGTGEFVKDASMAQRNDKEGHFATYNLTQAACQVQDILLAETYLASRTGQAPVIAGLAGMGGVALLAHGLANRAASTHVDLSGLDFAEDAAFLNQLYIPNLRRAGDLVTSIVLGGDRPVEVTGCSDAGMSERIEKAQGKKAI